MYDELIRRARELDKKATPGPWHGTATVMCQNDKGIYSEIWKLDDVRFAIQSRTLVPQLRDALETEQKEIERLIQMIASYQNVIMPEARSQIEDLTARAEKAEVECCIYKKALQK